jgi:hypothetical protein
VIQVEAGCKGLVAAASTATATATATTTASAAAAAVWATETTVVTATRAAAAGAITAGAITASTAVSAAAGAIAASTAVSAAAGAIAATTATTAVSATTGAITTATAAATKAAACAWGACLHRTGFVHNYATAAKWLTVHAGNSSLRLGIVAHFHKAKTLGAAGIAFHHDFSAGDSSKLTERLLQVFVTNRVRQIADVKFVAH